MQFADRRSTLLNADVVGYSAMMARHELGAAWALLESMSGLTQAVASHGGRVLDAPGDNLLAEFEDESAAVACALYVQQGACQRRRAQTPGFRSRTQFRIGIHSGVLIEAGEARYGHAINVSARLQGTARPGGVLVSADTASGLRPRDVRSSFTAPRLLHLKNIPVPMYGFHTRA